MTTMMSMSDQTKARVAANMDYVAYNTSWHTSGSIYFAFESLPGIFLEMPPGKKKIGGARPYLDEF